MELFASILTLHDMAAHLLLGRPVWLEAIYKAKCVLHGGIGESSQNMRLVEWKSG